MPFNKIALILSFTLLSTTQYLIAEPVSIQGEVIEVIEDCSDGSWKKTYQLQADGLSQVPLLLNKDQLENFGLSVGDIVDVTGDKTDSRHIKIDSATIIQSVKDISESEKQKQFKNQLAESRRALITIINFNDRQTSNESYGNATAQNSNMFSNSGSVNNIYKAGSLNQLEFARDIDNDGLDADVYTVNLNTSANNSCRSNYQNWGQSAREILRNQGVDLDQWQHHVYVLPPKQEIGCGWSGVAQLGCRNSCWAFVASGSTLVLGHELGHNLGLGHSGLDRDNDGSPESTYGDRGALMGNARQAHTIAAAHRDYSGWYDDYPELITNTDSSGNFILQPQQFTLDTLTNTTQTLKVNNPNNTQRPYYVAYHVQDAAFNPRGYSNQAIKITYISRGRTALIDSINVGESWRDNDAGLTISLSDASDASATVSVLYDNQPLPTASPSPTITPVPSASPTPSSCLPGTVNFNEVNFESYATSDGNGNVSVLEDGCAVKLEGNTWKFTDVSYTLQPTTYLEFEFKSTSTSEIHGLGLEAKNPELANGSRSFNLHGTQKDFGIFHFTYNESGNYHFMSIPVGQYFGRQDVNLTLIMDDDANKGGNSFFKNVRFVEK